MTDKERLFPVAGRLHSTAGEHHLGGADEIYDDVLKDNQENINKRVPTNGYFYGGDFYLDEEHTQKITPSEGVLYTDLDGKDVYLYDAESETFNPVGGEKRVSLNYIKVNVLASYNGMAGISMPNTCNVVLKDNTDNTTQTKSWNGKVLVFNNMNVNHSYTLSCSALNDYNSPVNYNPTGFDIMAGSTIDMVYSAYKYNIVIESNQGSSDTDISDAKITYNSKDYTNGQNIIQKTAISGLTDITVTDLRLKGYVCEITNIAYEIKARYKTCIVEINLFNNQKNSDTDNANVTFKYESFTYIGSNHKFIKIPCGVNFSYKCSNIEGYSIPAGSNNFDTESITFNEQYYTEIVTVNVSTDQEGVTAEGQVVTIYNRTYTVGETGTVKAKVPSYVYYEETGYYRLTVYSVNINDWTGEGKFVTPDTSDFQDIEANYKDYASRTIDLVYTLKTEEEITGYMIDQSGTYDNSYDIIRTVDGGEYTGAMNSNDDDDVIHRIRSNSHIYALKEPGDSNLFKIRQLSDENKREWSDGTSLGGAVFNMFMKLPEFWWRCYEKEANTDKWIVEFSMEEKDDWNHWEGDTFIGVYKAFMKTNDKAVTSLSNYTPTTSESWTTFTEKARILGNNGYSLITYESHQIMALLGWGWLGTTDEQSVVGYGSSTYPKNTGSRDSLGMRDTSINGEGDFYGGAAPGSKNNNASVNFWGLENFWGDIGEWVDNIKTANSSYLINILDSDLTTVKRTIQGVTSNGCISKLVLGANGDVIPKGYTGSDYSKYFASSGYVFGATGYVARRSSSGSGGNGGLGCLFVYYGAGNADSSIGSRLQYKGDYEIVDSF